MRTKASLAAAATVSAAVILTHVASGQSPERPPINKAQIDRWMVELSNWGRWGKDDDLGTLNLITTAKRQQAMALARNGVVVSMELPMVAVPKMAEVAADGKPNGVGYFEIRFRTFPPGDPRGNEGFSSDVQEFAAHGGPNTHIDALCHDSNKQGQLFNGYPLAETVTESEGCRKLGIDKLSTGIVTRGILVDMSRLKGSNHVPGSAVFVADLEAWEKQTGLRVSPGDALFVYDPGPMGENGRPRNGGFDISVAPWMHARGVALTGGFSRTPGVVDEPRADHRLAIAGMGLPLLDGADLSRLAETAAQQNRWEFMLVIAPIAAPGGTGSIVNPLAMF